MTLVQNAIYMYTDVRIFFGLFFSAVYTKLKRVIVSGTCLGRMISSRYPMKSWVR